MVPLAQLLKYLPQDTYRPTSELDIRGRSNESLELDRHLQVMKMRASNIMDLDRASLTEPEWLTKQKIVLNLRTCIYRSTCMTNDLILARISQRQDIDPQAFPHHSRYSY